MPEKHKISAEINGYTAEDYKRKAREIGDNAWELVCKVIESNKIQEKGFRICLGIINLTKK